MLLGLSCALAPRLASAQSNASFPEPAPAPPPPLVNPYPPSAPARQAAPAQPPPPLVNPYPPTPRDYQNPAVLPAMSPPPGTPTLQAPAASVVPYNLKLLPPILPYHPGLPVPPGYRVVERSNAGLTIGGGVTFAVSYLAGLGLAAGQGFGNGTAYTAIPVAGPWAAIGGRTFKCDSTVAVGATEKSVQNAINKCVGTAFDEVTTVVFLTADGLVQATGAVLFFVGLASGYQELEREDLPTPGVAVLPGGGMAFSLHGSF